MFCRLFLGLSTPVLQERCIITTAKQRNPSGRNQKNGLNGSVSDLKVGAVVEIRSVKFYLGNPNA